MVPAYDDPAHAVTEGIYRSGGCTAAYLVLTDGGRIIVNTGMGFEAPHHKRVFDAVRPGPTHVIITTQAHVDHVGGVDLFKEEGTHYVAQQNNQLCQADDARIRALRMRTAGIWFDTLGTDARRIAAENPGVPMRQAEPVPDVTFDRLLELDVDGLRLELHAAVGETIDSAIVWLPERRTALISNLFGPLFPHFPNLNTLRGDRYRFVEPYLESVRTVRALRPESSSPAATTRSSAETSSTPAWPGCTVPWTSSTDQALQGFNAGVDVWTLMEEITLPPELRVGQGYGKVSWAVRTLWESYVGWFKLQSTTELYPDSADRALAELAEAAGTEAVAEPGRGAPWPAATLRWPSGWPRPSWWPNPTPRSPGPCSIAAHRRLLDEGGDTSFWENGWLRTNSNVGGVTEPMDHYHVGIVVTDMEAASTRLSALLGVTWGPIMHLDATEYRDEAGNDVRPAHDHAVFHRDAVSGAHPRGPRFRLGPQRGQQPAPHRLLERRPVRSEHGLQRRRLSAPVVRPGGRPGTDVVRVPPGRRTRDPRGTGRRLHARRDAVPLRARTTRRLIGGSGPSPQFTAPDHFRPFPAFRR